MTRHLAQGRPFDFARDGRARTGDQALLVLEGATIRWGGRVYFRRTKWMWRRGEQWAVLGPNGSGKSLLGLALLGQAPVVEGEIGFCADGRPEMDPTSPLSENSVALVSPHAQRQLLAQESTFYQARWHSGIQEGQRTVVQLLSQASVEGINPFEVKPKMSHSGDFRKRRRELVGRFGLEPLLKRKAIQLSNGEQRKVLLARALLRHPRLLILDDPYSGLDRSSRALLKEVVHESMGQGLLVMVITSRPDEIPAGTTHLLLAAKNRIVAQGPKSAMMRHPLVARLKALDRAGHALTPGTSAARTDAAGRRPGPSSRSRGEARPASQASPLVEFEDVTIRHGRKRILHRIDWRMLKGENWALLGPNGSGKTTFLSLIQGDHPQAYALRIRLFGTRPSSTQTLWRMRQRMGWVSPELHLHYAGTWNCLEVVCSGFFNTVGLYQACSARQRARARHCLLSLGLAGAEDRSFGELSFGEQRVVLLARAVVKRPRLLVLDEPCQGLDSGHRRAILEAVDRIVPETGASLIFVTHHRREMPRCITHVLKLKSGRVQSCSRGEIR